MNIKVTADSTCDLLPALIERNNITVVPLKIVKDGKYYSDGVDIVPDDIFAHVANGGALCSTAAVNVEEYTEIFARFADDYDAVIHINIGSKFSSCYQNACIAAESFGNVYVIDSQNLSTGQGLLVLEACDRSASCTDAAVLAQELRDLASRLEVSFIINRLDYLAKGGRCSMITALGANLLKLKPCIEVLDGSLHVGKKYRGSYAKCLANYIRDRLSNRDDIIRDRLFMTHTPVAESDLEIAREIIGEIGGFKQVIETPAGCTISCHCGPGTLGVLLIRK